MPNIAIGAFPTLVAPALVKQLALQLWPCQRHEIWQDACGCVAVHWLERDVHLACWERGAETLLPIGSQLRMARSLSDNLEAT